MFKLFHSRTLHSLYVVAGLLFFFAVSNAPGQLIISEFRIHGPGGFSDEFIELYNNSGADHTVNGGGSGYSVAGSNGSVRCTVPNGTVIPNRGHFLCVNVLAYSLGNYPAGNGTTASANDNYSANFPDNSGIALFNNTVGGASFILANRLDAVGSTTEANTLYKEGAGYPAITSADLEQTFYRKMNGPGGLPQDTGDNAADFAYANTQATDVGMGSRLGYPGPENLSSPIQRNASFTVGFIDQLCGVPCGRVRTTTPVTNGPLGTLSIRRRVTNNTGANVTRLRFRVVDVSTTAAPGGSADLRLLTSNTFVLVLTGGAGSLTVQGLTLEGAAGQPSGGGHNSSVSAGTVTLATPLPNGAFIDVHFLFGVVQEGTPRFYFVVEALP